VKDYKERYGYYPEAVLADQIYRSRGNLGGDHWTTAYPN
jgi:hypothetical protein